MYRTCCLLLLIYAAQRSFTMRVSDPSEREDDYAWKTREALREYLNFLLGGIRRDEQEMGGWQYNSGGSYLGQDDDPVPLYSRHRPSLGYSRDPDGFYHRRTPDQVFGVPQDTDESRDSIPELSEKQSNFAVPPTDPRYFEKSLPVQNYGDGDPEYQLVVTRKEADPIGVTEDTEAAVKDLENMKGKLLSGQGVPVPLEVVQDDIVAKQIDIEASKENIILIALVAGCSTGVVAGVALLIYGFIKLQRNAKAAADVEYPAYGVTGPNKESTPTGDRRLAHSAQMYHYQLTKQQIIAMESNRGTAGERRGSISEADSDDDNEEGDYTVYECPGLAPTGEMEVKNPLFQDDPTPATTSDQVDGAVGGEKPPVDK
uniref:Neural proliferation differentiation and control protein 1 n=2 Tax=Lygus hesperus TaxID=30085 RepID=A0A146ME08_LYGHE